MKNNLRTVGFTKKKDIDDIKNELEELYNSISEEEKHNDVQEIEIVKYCGNKIGVVSTYTKKNEQMLEKVQPYLETDKLQRISNISIKKIKNNKTTEIIIYGTEKKTKSTLVFHLQNRKDEMEDILIKSQKEVIAKIFAVSIGSKVILPALKSKNIFDNIKEDIERDIETLRNIQTDNIDSGKSLGIDKTIENIEKVINELEKGRTKKVEITIENCFTELSEYISFNKIDITYEILGTIKKVEEVINEMTNEIVYKMLIYISKLEFELIVNKKDLMGLPTKNMRISGKFKLFGKIG